MSVPLTVLSVSYSLAPIGRDAAGGAEQVLSAIDRGLVRRGHRSLIVAPEGSLAAGTLVCAGHVPRVIDDAARIDAQRAHARAISRALADWSIDLVHMHGFDYTHYLPPPGVPVLATLHLPPTWYTPDALWPRRPDTWIHGVSTSQARALPDGPHVLPPVPNGVPIGPVAAARRRSSVVFLGRICPEKGVHLAIDAARAARASLAVAGPVFPYPTHQQYFHREIVPRLDARRRYLGPIGGAAKQRRLARARCVLIPSQAPETSSLVAMEALACGTPVVAFDAGALPDIVDHGRTGFLVRTVAEMADAIDACGDIDRDACLQAARDRFDGDAMVSRYVSLYRSMIPCPSRVDSSPT